MRHRSLSVGYRVDDIAVLFEPAHQDAAQRLVIFSNEHPHDAIFSRRTLRASDAFIETSGSVPTVGSVETQAAPTAPVGLSDSDGVEANARLTSAIAVPLLFLLAAEGATLPFLHTLLRPHVFLGFALIPLVALKLGSTLYRFGRYYTGAESYRRKGPPPTLLRLLGPVVIIATITLLASGVLLVLAGDSWQNQALFLHKASFVLWFGAMTVHVVGHIVETATLGTRDWAPSSTRALPRAAGRRWLLALGVAAGGLLGAWSLGHLGVWAHR
jgi:hypothetical protein